MKDLMIDLETLGQGPDAVVLSIGAVFFDIESEKVGNGFYTALDMAPQLKAGRKTNAETIKWWMSQGQAARHVFEDEALHPIEALNRFVEFIKNESEDAILVWGNGSTFDIIILERLLKDFNYAPLWPYSNIMDLRTFRRFVGKGKKIPRSEGHHNALVDAVDQANYVLHHTRK